MTFKVKYRFLIIILLLICPVLSIHAQNDTSDSLITLLNQTKNDKDKLTLLNQITKSFINTQPDNALVYGKLAISAAQKVNDNAQLALAYKYLGIAHFNKGDYVNALDNYELSKNTYIKAGDKKGEANILSNIGNIYFNKGDDAKALEYYLQSLRIAEEIGDTLRIVTTLVNSGAVYAMKKQTYDKAISFWKKAYPLSVAINDENNISAISVNIGEVFREQGLYDSAMHYFNIAYKVDEGTENFPYTLNAIGIAYRLQNKYDDAIAIQTRAVNEADILDDKNYKAIALVGLAESYQAKGDISNALKSFLDAEQSANETKANYTLRDIYKGLSDIYSKRKDYASAFRYQQMLLNIKDTLYNIEADKKLGTLQFTYDLEKKENQINLLTKDQELKEQEISRQKIVRNSFIGGFAIMLVFSGIFLRQRNRIRAGKKRSDELLLNILPEETAEELKATGSAKARSFDMVSVLFTDFKNFTLASEKLSPEELVQEIDYCFSAFDSIVSKHGIEKIKTIGDAYMCAAGLPVQDAQHAEKIVLAGLEMQQFMKNMKEERLRNNQLFFELRLGIHSGPVVAGVVGSKKFAYDIWGDTVNTASRMESSGEIGKVNISGTTYDLIKDKFHCTHRGKITAKNKGEIDMYFVENALA